MCVKLFALSPYIDLRKAKTYIDEKFQQAKVETHPFPHLVIRDILPFELYQQMHQFWPAPSLFCHQNLANRHMYVTKGCTEWMPLTYEQRLFWRIFGEVVGRYVKQNIQKALIPYLNWKFPQLSNDEISKLKNNLFFLDSRQDSLMEHHFPYCIPPHVDQHSLFAAALLYCPTEYQHEHMATIMYELENPNDDVNSFWKFPLKEVKRIPYTPNTLVVMLQNPWQIHGSAPHNERGYIRKMYGFFVQMEPELIEKLYPDAPGFLGSPDRFTAEWMYYYWEERYMTYKPDSG